MLVRIKDKEYVINLAEDDTEFGLTQLEVDFPDRILVQGHFCAGCCKRDVCGVRITTSAYVDLCKAFKVG